jgi:glycosyltransferase involved in cell wall biosynthesis
LPGAVLESCAAGTPVLGSDLPGIREIAAQLPTCVRFLPLDADDAEWALLALKLINKEVEANIALNSFDFGTGIFNIEKCSEDFCNLWKCYVENYRF